MAGLMTIETNRRFKNNMIRRILTALALVGIITPLTMDSMNPPSVHAWDIIGGLVGKTISVPAKSGSGLWTDTGLMLLPGFSYEVSATGKWGSGTWKGNANGTGKAPGGTFIMPKESAYSLIGRLGSGEPFYIGISQLIVVKGTSAQTLYLAMNDSPGGFWNSRINDNYDELRVTIRKQ